MERATLAPGYEISRVIRGGWQLSEGHSAADRAGAVDDLLAAFDAGITTFDGADIYTGVEELYGALRRRIVGERGAGAADSLRVHTKCVPDLSALATLSRQDVRAMIDRSRQRLGVDTLDLVQFHWWDHGVPRHLEVARWLAELQAEGAITLLGGTNFDTDALLSFVEAGVPMRTMQVQYSLLDTRPAARMVPAALAHGVALLAYGTVAGGFLSERWLGRSEPREPFENRSLRKYKLVVDDVGGWDALQSLLETLKAVADEAETDIATLASRSVLEREGVAAVIVGARDRAHLAANLAVGALRLTADQIARIERVAGELTPLEGDVFALERDRGGRHGAIMKYNLNAGEQ
jgi:aryl-alcohol dehydrogenase-like predicted oxidoreductase